MHKQQPYFVLSQWSAAPQKRIEAYIRSSSPLDAKRLQALRASLNACFELAALGAFPAGLVAPEFGLVETSPSDETADQSIGPPFEVTDVDYRIFHVATNLLSHAEERLLGMVFRELAEAGSVFERFSWRFLACRDESDVTAFPPMSPTLPFRLVGEDAADQIKGRRCLVTADEPLEASGFASLLRVVEAWAALLGAGGYSSTVSDSLVTLGSLHAYDEYSIEVVWSLFGASEAAWFGLVNALRVPAASLSINEVVIE